MLHFEGEPPAPGDLAAHLAARLPLLPALACHLPPGGAVWRTTRVDVAEHLTEIVLPPGTAALNEALQRLVRAPLPVSAPPWRLWLLHGHAAGQYVVLYRVHHALQDGSGVLHTLETLFAEDAEVRSRTCFAGLGEPVRATLGDRGRTAAATAAMLRKERFWGRDRDRFSDERVFRWAEVPSAWLTEAARSHGVARNDVYLAALAHAVTRWAADQGTETGSGIRVDVPVSIRRAGEVGMPGNRTTVVPLRIATAGLTPVQCLRHTARVTAPLRSPVVREALRRNDAMLPAWLVTALYRVVRDPTRAGVSASHMALRGGLAFHGAPVTRALPLTCALDGTPLSVSLLTCRDVAAACFVTDAAVPGLDRLHLRWRASVRSLASG
ncbi:wax ester/triacylglycerol synthase domain-containing protein [Streptomyces sp. NPDC090994]|uniref:wax ester/triacylglycerol synthase domain-containing protein n=1 Tax=Streptomyces sp. NPDC090994 TaxID=3365969 RepID=UPI0038076F88